jgi:hypothetical protein
MRQRDPQSFKSSTGRSLKSLTVPTLLGLLCFLVYNANFRQIGAGDTLPARFLPLILWQKGTFDFQKDARLVAHGHSMLSERNRPANADSKVAFFEPWAYWTIRTREHRLASLYPVVTPLLVTPLYLPAYLWLNEHGWHQPEVGRVAELMEKLSASLIASITVVLLYLLFRREGIRWSLVLALAFAFGTNNWMISSQALWQHGTGALLIVLALLLLNVPASAMRHAWLGAVCVLIAANRPPDGLIAVAIGLYVMVSRGRDSWWLLIGGAVPLAALLCYNLGFVGHLAGGYAIAQPEYKTFFQTDWSGVPGLLISPARGLLVFSPLFLFLPLGLMLRWRSAASRGLALALGCGVAAQLLLYAQADWRAGESWGPRWLTDILPVLMWMLAPAPSVLRPLARGLFAIAVMASAGVQTVGAFWYTKTSDDLIFAGDSASMRGAWALQNTPFLTELRHPPACAELLRDARGSIDLVGQSRLNGTTGMPTLENGAVIEGWALTGGRTPAQMLAMIDGVVIGSTTQFLTRVDVNEALRTDAPSGWRVYANLLGVTPGKRTLQLAVRIAPRSDIRIACELRVMVVAPPSPATIAPMMPLKPASEADLNDMAARAALLLRERQNEQGYWLTSFTNDLRYEAPQQEMNTFLTSMLVDLLAPIAEQRGLNPLLQRARRHLAAQIESNGLVRYHGLPDGPTIGTQGIIITPDSDDTALAWRLAGPGASDPRLKGMLDELARYRDARGLYRTWLAPQKDYQGLDPGFDPNPADITIQMHVYLMLRDLDPPAAAKLCKALERSHADGDIWIYYSKAPLIPYLRSAELQQLGCAIPLPAERLALAADGQEVWSEAARLFVETSTSQDAKVRQAARHLLARLGGDDFALLRRSPPLLYHNDLTATVKRYYWSEDFGFAFWLRLHEAVLQTDGSKP